MAFGLTLDELCTIYRVQFPVLNQNERDTWYDRNGRIVFTVSRLRVVRVAALSPALPEPGFGPGSGSSAPNTDRPPRPEGSHTGEHSTRKTLRPLRFAQRPLPLRASASGRSPGPRTPRSRVGGPSPNPSSPATFCAPSSSTESAAALLAQVGRSRQACRSQQAPSR